MAVIATVAAPRHRYRRVGDQPQRPDAFEWLADLNPVLFRHRDGSKNLHRIAAAAGMVTSTLTRQHTAHVQGRANTLTVQVMDALIALAMRHGIPEAEAREALFVFELDPETAAAADKARRLRRAIARVEAAA